MVPTGTSQCVLTSRFHSADQGLHRIRQLLRESIIDVKLRFVAICTSYTAFVMADGKTRI
jgi:hypothetical protein